MSERTKSLIEERYLADVDLAELLGLSRAMIHKMRGQGMPSHTFGRSRRYLLSEVRSWASSTDREAS